MCIRDRSGSLFSLFLFLTLFIQNVIGYGPFQAGLRFLPLTVPVLLVAPIAGRATVRVPIRLILALGLVLVAVGLVLMSGLSGGSGFTHLLPGFIVGGGNHQASARLGAGVPVFADVQHHRPVLGVPR